MTTVNEAREAIYNMFINTFIGVTADRIAFDNEEFNAPSSGSWVRLVTRTGTRKQDTLGEQGNRRFRTGAKVFVQVYTDSNTGVQTGDSISRQAADVFDGMSFNSLDFGASVTRELGPDGKWYQHLVEVDFDYDDIK